MYVFPKTTSDCKSKLNFLHMNDLRYYALFMSMLQMLQISGVNTSENAE